MVSFFEWLDYVECSYRRKFSDRVPILSIHHAKVVALSEAARYYLTKAADGRRATLDELKTRLSRAWQRVKQENHFTFDWRDLMALQTQMERLRDLVTDKDAVVAVNFPVRICPSEIPIESDIDAIILKNQESPTKQYLQVLLFDYTTFAHRSRRSPLLRFNAGVHELALRPEKLSNLPRKYSFLRLVDGQVRTIGVRPFEEKEVLGILRSVEKGMKKKVWVPTTDPKTCRDCLFTKDCSWVSC